MRTLLVLLAASLVLWAAPATGEQFSKRQVLACTTAEDVTHFITLGADGAALAAVNAKDPKQETCTQSVLLYYPGPEYARITTGAATFIIQELQVIGAPLSADESIWHLWPHGVLWYAVAVLADTKT